MKRKRVPILKYIILTFLVMSSGCASKHIAKRDLLGTYRVKYSYGTAVLVLKGNGRYEEQFRYPSGRTLTNTGPWQFRDIGYGPEVVLQNALDQNNVYARKSASSIGRLDWTLPVTKAAGKVTLPFDDDQGLAFEKE